MTKSAIPTSTCAGSRARSPRAVIVILAFIVASLPAIAASAAKHAFDVQAGMATESLREFSAQAGEQILFPDSAIAGVKTNAVKGALTSLEALDRLLKGTGLVAV